VAKVSQILGEQLFPERRLLLQSAGRVRHVALPGWLQAMMLAASLATVGGIAYLGVGYAHLDNGDNRAAATPVNSELTQAAPAPTMPVVVMATPPAVDPALGDLQTQVAAMHQQIANLNQSYTQANTNYQQANDKLTALATQNTQLQAQLTNATAQIKTVQDQRDDAVTRAKTTETALNSKTGNATQLAKTLDDSKNQLQQSEAERTTLQNRVQQLEMDLQSAQNRESVLDAKNQLLQQQQVVADSQHLSASANTTPLLVPPLPTDAVPPERKPAPAVPHAQNTATTTSAPVAVAAVAPVAALATLPSTSSSGNPSQFEQLLASTGLDIDRLLHGLGSQGGGEGGPYIALNDPRAAQLDRQRLDDLKRLATTLPLATPLVSYQLESGFGARVDPINHRASFHPGLDMSAPYRTTVFSTGAGTVIFTGNLDSYGRVVEIDHGHGIVTRYAHLHRILVAKGQKVAVHTPIAELGSTGRSTGPHLHYEVHVDGAVVDPSKFMQAGKNVVQISGQQ
jgi:murein DD-endopeptidase MepM/ murein hydrolase activator NlpD